MVKITFKKRRKKNSIQKTFKKRRKKKLYTKNTFSHTKKTIQTTFFIFKKRRKKNCVCTYHTWLSDTCARTRSGQTTVLSVDFSV